MVRLSAGTAGRVGVAGTSGAGDRDQALIAPDVDTGGAGALNLRTRPMRHSLAQARSILETPWRTHVSIWAH
ncbi:hypothetical protein [Lysobacter gummosus]|uniref:hypothetical protein n=1 Tax=Lysobacter gummosus TaxID=262324 RepID=UPI003644DFF4